MWIREGRVQSRRRLSEDDLGLLGKNEARKGMGEFRKTKTGLVHQ
jgi:hypothetical protein